MKVVWDTDDDNLSDALLDFTSAITIARLKKSLLLSKEFNSLPGDRKYNKKYAAAVKIVLEHFGG